jgi:hypothetical protein
MWKWIAVLATLMAVSTGVDAGDKKDNNLLADPKFKIIEDGAFVHWYSPNPSRTAGTPDRGSCKLGVPADICLQFSSEWPLEPTWAEIDEASFRLKCGGEACLARLDVVIDRTLDDQCEGPETLDMRDAEGNLLVFGDDWFVVNLEGIDACLYTQYFDVGREWARTVFSLDLPDRRIGSFGVVSSIRISPRYPMWVDDAVLKLIPNTSR